MVSEHRKIVENKLQLRISGEISMKSEVDEEEMEKKKKMFAQKRKAEILAQMSASQKAFQEKHADEINTESHHAHEHSEKEVLECALCRETSEKSNSFVSVCYLQNSRSVDLTNRLSRNKYYNAQDSPKTEGKSEILVKSTVEIELWRDLDNSNKNFHASTCGHHLHIECFHKYYASLLERLFSEQMYEGRGEIDVNHGEFLCPTCRRLSNCCMPVATDPANPEFYTNKEGIDLSIDLIYEWISKMKRIEESPVIPSSTNIPHP